MPFNRPSLAQLNTRVAADIEAHLTDTDPVRTRSVIGVLARAFAGAQHEIWNYLDWVSKQMFDADCDDDTLVVRAAQYGLVRGAATAASGSITVRGTDDTAVPAGTVWRTADGVQYASAAAGTIAAGSAAVAVRAVVAGSAGNAAAGTRMSLSSPIPGIVSEASAAAAFTGGVDIESIDSLRLRLQARRQNPPRGGGPGDYVLWAKDASQEVTRAWERPRTPGLGDVTLYFMADNSTANGIPTDALVTAIQAAIDGVAPVTANPIVAKPTAVALNLTITSVTPDTPAVRAAIQAEIADLILREAEPGGTLLLTHISEAISTAEGETDHVLTAPAANVVRLAGEITTMGVITWQ